MTSTIPFAVGSAGRFTGSPLASVCAMVSFGSNANAFLEVSHFPSCVMPMGMASYLAGSRDHNTDSAERREISCSPERPPNTTPTRIFFAVFIGQQPHERLQPRLPPGGDSRPNA